MLSLTLRVLWFALAILGLSAVSAISLILTLPSQRCPSDMARLHPICLRHWHVLGVRPLLHHGHRP